MQLKRIKYEIKKTFFFPFFMLSTFALFMMGLVIIFQKRKKLELNLDLNEIKRNYKYFLAAYLVAMLAGFLSGTVPKIPIVCFLLFLYGVYVFRTIGKSKKCFCESCLEELAFAKFFDGLNRSKDFCIFFQLIVSIVFLTLSVHFFVKEIIYFSGMLNISPLILSFIVTPFATELPECVNSIIWLKQNKDDLAMANVLGAVVFQTTILFSLGIILTPWNVDFGICLNIILAIISSLLFVIGITICKKINFALLLFVGSFYFLYLMLTFLLF